MGGVGVHDERQAETLDRADEEAGVQLPGVDAPEAVVLYLMGEVAILTIGGVCNCPVREVERGPLLELVGVVTRILGIALHDDGAHLPTGGEVGAPDELEAYQLEPVLELETGMLLLRDLFPICPGYAIVVTRPEDVRLALADVEGDGRGSAGGAFSVAVVRWGRGLGHHGAVGVEVEHLAVRGVVLRGVEAHPATGVGADRLVVEVGGAVVKVGLGRGLAAGAVVRHGEQVARTRGEGGSLEWSREGVSPRRLREADGCSGNDGGAMVCATPSVAVLTGATRQQQRRQAQSRLEDPCVPCFLHCHSVLL